MGWKALLTRTIILQLFDGGNHFAVQLPRRRVQERAFAGAVVVFFMALVGTVPDCPLCPLLDGEEAKRAVTFAGRGLALAHLWANAAGRFTSAVADKQHLFQPRDRFLGPADDHGIPHRRAVTQYILVNGLQGREAAAFWGGSHGFAHGLAGDEG